MAEMSKVSQGHEVSRRMIPLTSQTLTSNCKER